MRSEILHHYIEFAFDFIYNQCDPVASSIHKEHLCLFAHHTYGQREQLRKHRQRIEVVLNHHGKLPTYRGVLEVVQASNCLNYNGWNCKLLSTCPHHHCTLDSQTGWELHS